MSNTVGSYQVVRRLPGDGEAYLAKARGGAECLVRRYEAPADAEAWEEAEKHVAICATVSHRAVCGVVEVFQDGGKIAVVNRAPPDGTTLDAVIAKGKRLDANAAWYLGAQIAAALGAIQAAADDADEFITISHGHLSPSCIHISWNGDVRVEGFGLGPLAGSSGIDSGAGYAPPEPKATPRGDVYSLAAIVWAALAGKRPSGTLAFDQLGVSVPASLAGPLSRATEHSLGQRKVTSMELAHAFGEVSAADGQRMLAGAVAAFRAASTPTAGPVGTVLSSQTPSSQMPSSQRPLGGALAGGLSGKRVPSPRSARGGALTGALGAKKPLGSPRPAHKTILGQAAPRPQMSSSPPIDWSKESNTVVSRPPVIEDDDLGWGAEDEDEPTQLRPRPDIAKLIAQAEARKRDDEDESTVIATRPPELIAALEELGSEPAQFPLASDEEATRVAPRPVWSEEQDTLIEKRRTLEQAKKDKPGARPRASSPAISKTMPLDDPAESLSALQAPPSHRPPGEVRPLAALSDDDDEDAAQPAAASEVLVSRVVDIGTDSGGDAPAPLDASDSAERLSSDPLSSDPLSSDPLDTDPPVVGSLIDEVLGDASPSAALERRGPPDATDDDGLADLPGLGQPAAPQPAATPSRAGLGSSPWSPADVAASSTPISLMTAVLISVATAVVVLASGIYWVRVNATLPPPPARSASPDAQPPDAQPPGSASRLETTAASASAGTVSPAPSASASAAAASTADDGAALTPTLGYLMVKFEGAGNAEVFLFGKSYGKVNAKLEVPCKRPAFVRVGTVARAWLTDGEPVQIRCQATTEISMRASR